MEEQISKMNPQIYASLPCVKEKNTSLLKVPCHLTTWQSEIQLIQNKIHIYDVAVNKEKQRIIDIKKHCVRHAWYKIRGQLQQRLYQRENAWFTKSKMLIEEEKHLKNLQKEIHFAQTYLHQCQNTERKRPVPIETSSRLWSSFSFNDTSSHLHRDDNEQSLSEEEEEKQETTI